MTYDHPEVIDAVRRALAEDIGPGDMTTQACVPADRSARAGGFSRASRRCSRAWNCSG